MRHNGLIETARQQEQRTIQQIFFPAIVVSNSVTVILGNCLFGDISTQTGTYVAYYSVIIGRQCPINSREAEADNK